MEWVISDTHFFHRNVIGFCQRPFADLAQMHECLIRRWNAAVKLNDTVYHLGDVGFGSRAELGKIVKQLHGKKILCLGNHDTGRSSMEALGFDFACEEIVLNGFAGVKVLLRHRPLSTPPPPGVGLVVHGHIHNSTHRQRESVGEDGFIPPWNINVSCEVINYTPVSLDYIIRTACRDARVYVAHLDADVKESRDGET